MRLTHKGLRAADRTFELGRLNAFVGPSSAGKTTALDALAIVANGYVPRLGKGKEATARLMRGPAMRCELVLDDGTTLAGGLRRDGDSLTAVGITHDSERPEAKEQEARKAILARFGRTEDEAAQNTDPRAIFRVSAAERRAALDRLLAPAEPAVDRAVRLAAARITFGREALSKVSLIPADAAALRTLLGSVADEFDVVTDELRRRIPEGLPSAARWARDSLLAAREEVRRKTSARGEIEERALDAGKAADTQEALAAKRDAEVARRATLERALAEHAKATAALREHDAAHRAALSDVDHADAAVAAAAALLRGVEGHAAALAALLDPEEPRVPGFRVVDHDAVREATGALRAEHDALVPPDDVEPPARVAASPEALERARRAGDEAARLDALARSVAMPVIPTADPERAAVAAAEAAIQRAKQNPWREVEVIVHQICEFLERNGPDAPVDLAMEGFDALLRLAHQHGGDLASFEAEATKAREALAAKLARIEAATAAAAKAEAERRQYADAAEAARTEARTLREAAIQEAAAENDRLDAAFRAAQAEVRAKRRQIEESRAALRERIAEAERKARAEVDAANAAARTEHQRACAAVAERRAANEAERARLRAEVAAAERADRAAKERKAAADKRLAEVEGLRTGLAAGPAIDEEATRAELVASDAARARLDERIRALKMAEARRAEMKALLGEIAKADAIVEVFAAVDWAVARTAEQDMRERTGPILDAMRVVLRAAGIEREPYLEISTGVSDVGWLDEDGRRISVDGAMGGGESTLVLAALSAAMVRLRAPQVRVLLIETAEAHSGFEARLFAGLAAVADWFDAILVAAPEAARHHLSEAWTVFDFGVKEVGHAA